MKLFWDVDTQRDFMEKGRALYVEGTNEIRARLGELKTALRKSNELVWGSADYHSEGDAELSDDPDFEQTFPPHCLRDTDGWKRIPETQPIDPTYIALTPRPERDMTRLGTIPEDELYFRKNEFDVFTNPNLETAFQALQPSRIIIFGVTLDVCVRYAVNGFLERGYNVTLLPDATRAIDKSKRSELLDEWDERGVRLRETEEVIDEL